MKRFLCMAIIIFLFIPRIMAQTEKGKWMINPEITTFGVGGTDNDKSKSNRFNFGLGFKGGSFIYDDLLVNVGIGFDINKQEKWKDNSLQLSGGLKYYILSHLFLGAEIGYEREWLREYEGDKTLKNNYFFFGADLGYAIFITPNISIEPAIYWKHSFADRLNQYGFKVGFGLYF